jgi:Tfp pilus assembly protein PilN
MRAINLIPVEARRGGGAPGRTGFVPYALVGLLAVLVIGALGWVLLDNQVKDRKAELAKTEIQATSTEAEATALKPYVTFAQLKEKRLQTVQQLISSRFDWDQVLHDLSKAIPSDAWLVTFDGSTTGAAGAAGAVAVTATPTIKLSGCANSHDDVATMLTRFRLVRGVTRVSLESSERGDPGAKGSATGSAGTATAGGSSGGCNGVKHPAFNVTIYFAGASAPATGTGTTGTPGATPASSTTTTTSTTPAQPGTSTTSTTTTTSSTSAVTSK